MTLTCRQNGLNFWVVESLSAAKNMLLKWLIEQVQKYVIRIYKGAHLNALGNKAALTNQCRAEDRKHFTSDNMSKSALIKLPLKTYLPLRFKHCDICDAQTEKRHTTLHPPHATDNKR